MLGAKSSSTSEPGPAASLAALMGLPSQAVSGGGRTQTQVYLKPTGYWRRNSRGLQGSRLSTTPNSAVVRGISLPSLGLSFPYCRID